MLLHQLLASQSAFAAQLPLQEEPPHTYGEQSEVERIEHTPAPSQYEVGW